MRSTDQTLAVWLLPLGLLTGLSAWASVHAKEVEGVTLSKPFEIVATTSLSPMLASKIQNLAKIDPVRPHPDEMDVQTLSMFGREDLIADVSNNYKPNGCAPLAGAAPVFDEIVRRAGQTSIVIVNESHERSEHRGFTAEIATRLRALGYDTLAMETLSNPQAGTPERYLPAFVARPGQPYLEDSDGYYLSEAGFGRLGRTAKALGYRLLPYEINHGDGLPKDAGWDQRIAVREEAEASNLAVFVREHPSAKLLIHVGYSHAGEVPKANGAKWMATRLKQKTGIDPLTISQTTCRGGSDVVHLAALPASELPGTFDLVVDHPRGHFTRGRPDWRRLAGDRPVDIPRELLPVAGWRVIEARPIGEPATSVPMDRVAIRPGEDIALMLPPGQYYLQAVDVPEQKQALPKL